MSPGVISSKTMCGEVMHSGSAGSNSGARLIVLSAGELGTLVLLEIRLALGITGSSASACWNGFWVGFGSGLGGESSCAAEKVPFLLEDVLSGLDIVDCRSGRRWRS